MLCAETSVTQDTRPDHAQYIANWLQLLKDDPKAIFTAAAKASWKQSCHLKSTILGLMTIGQRVRLSLHHDKYVDL